MIKKFPPLIPVFPLSGVIYFPKTNLPLNIFEQRYLDLVNDVIEKDNLMGMIQSTRKDNRVYNVGCLGKINDHQKSEDGRILINLTGITRFEIVGEVKNSKPYREFKVDYKKFTLDTKPEIENVNTEILMKKTKTFFETQKINTLAMIAPITNEEKQKLLETVSLNEKVKVLQSIVNFYLHDVNFKNETIQ